MMRISMKIRKKMFLDIKQLQDDNNKPYLERVRLKKPIPRDMYYFVYKDKELRKIVNNIIKEIPKEFKANIIEYYNNEPLSAIYYNGLSLNDLCKKYCFIEALLIIRDITNGRLETEYILINM